MLRRGCLWLVEESAVTREASSRQLPSYPPSLRERKYWMEIRKRQAEHKILKSFEMSEKSQSACTSLCGSGTSIVHLQYVTKILTMEANISVTFMIYSVSESYNIYSVCSKKFNVFQMMCLLGVLLSCWND